MSQLNQHPYAPERNCGDLGVEGKLKLPPCDKTVDHWQQADLTQLNIGDKSYWVCPPVLEFMKVRNK